MPIGTPRCARSDGQIAFSVVTLCPSGAISSKHSYCTTLPQSHVMTVPKMSRRREKSDSWKFQPLLTYGEVLEYPGQRMRSKGT